MKVHSITFQSLTDPIKMGLWSGVANSPQEAYQIGLSKLIADQGDMAWRPIMQTSFDITIVPPPIAPVDNSVSYSENWLMKKIVENKDLDLFNASKKYLTEPEQLYITEKIK